MCRVQRVSTSFESTLKQCSTAPFSVQGIGSSVQGASRVYGFPASWLAGRTSKNWEHRMLAGIRRYMTEEIIALS